MTKARFWVSNQMRPTGAGAVYPAAAADGIHRREVNFRLEYESEREVSGRQRALSQHGSTAGHGHPRTGDITAFVGSQQHVHRCELGRLARAAKWWSSPKFATLFLGHGSWYQRSPDRTGCDAVHSIPFSPNSCAKLAEKFAMAALVAA